MVPKDFQDFYYLLCGIVAVVAWLIRLEAKVLYLAKSDDKHESHRKETWDKFDQMHRTLTEILQAISKLEGRLDK